MSGKLSMREIVILVVLVAGILVGVGREFNKANPNKYLTTPADPIVQVSKEGMVLVRTDCTTNEYREAIGQLVKQMMKMDEELKKLAPVKPPVVVPEVKPETEIKK